MKHPMYQKNGGNHRDDNISGVTNLLSDPLYLELTYSATRLPYGSYPKRLAAQLTDSIFISPGKLLELGCGRGEYLTAFKTLGFDVTGVDISPASRELVDHGYEIYEADLECDELPFPLGDYDFVFSKSVVEHTADPVKFLRAGFSALRPGGIAVVMTPSWEHTYWGPFFIDHTHITPFTRPSLTDAMQFAGFEDVRTQYFWQLPFLWRHPKLLPIVRLMAKIPLPYSPMHEVNWPESVNKFIRFSKEAMLLAVGRKPDHSAGTSR